MHRRTATQDSATQHKDTVAVVQQISVASWAERRHVRDATSPLARRSASERNSSYHIVLPQKFHDDISNGSTAIALTNKHTNTHTPTDGHY